MRELSAAEERHLDRALVHQGRKLLGRGGDGRLSAEHEVVSGRSDERVRNSLQLMAAREELKQREKQLDKHLESQSGAVSNIKVKEKENNGLPKFLTNF